MQNYLEKFRSGLKAVQSQQILQLLTKEKNNGSITSIEEFKKRLEQLTEKLQSETLKPTTQLFLARFQDIIDSESFNFMIERIQDDLSAAYIECNTIDEVLLAHENIINNVVLQNLEIAVNEMESKITSLEFINKNKQGFDNAIFNTFRITQNNRSGDSVSLFVDPKTGLTNLGSAQAQIDIIGEKLIIGPEIEIEYKPSSVRQIFDFESINSELDVQFESSNITNIIDSKRGTFWGQSVLLSNAKGEDGVTTKLEIDLGNVQSINYLEIEPFILYPIELSGISIIDGNNQAIAILTEAIEINTLNKLFFNTVAAKKIILKFKNKNYSLVQFATKPGSPVPSAIRSFSSLNTSIQNISSELDNLISSPILSSSINLSDFNYEDKSFYEYFIGFDNIRLGIASFNDVSIFVSKPEKINQIGEVALQVTEKRPIGGISSSSVEYTLNTHPSSFDDYFHASIEYYVIKKDYSEDNALLSSLTVPVLTLSNSQIRHERLYLTQKSSPSDSDNNIGFLQFYTIHNPYHSVDNPTGTIRVYRNSQLLENADSATGPNATVESDGWRLETNLTENTPGNGKAMRYYIEIQNPNPSNIYTVSYIPAKSTSTIIPNNVNLTSYLAEEGLNIVDLDGNLKAWLGSDNIIYFKEQDINVNYSTLNLVIVLRRNSANINLTPVVDDYLLASGKVNKKKFGD